MNTRGMTPMAHHAMCLAAGGYWQLADAMELLQLVQEDERVQAIHHCNGHTAMIGLAEVIETGECDECSGTGELECDMGHMHSCYVCGGDGSDGEPVTDRIEWMTLNGDTDPSFKPNPIFILYAADAKVLVRDYGRLIDSLQRRSEVQE